MQGSTPNLPKNMQNNPSQGTNFFDLLKELFVHHAVAAGTPPPEDTSPAQVQVPRSQSEVAPPAPTPPPAPVPQANPANSSNPNVQYNRDRLQSPQEVAAAAGNTPAPPVSATGIGEALSGIKAPQGTGYNQPNAPGIPQTRSVQSNLMDILAAAGLAAPKVAPGLNLKQRF